MLTSAQIADKWVKNTSGASQAYTDGVKAVTTSPMDQAAANVNGYLQGVQDAVTSGKYVRGLKRRTLADWQDACVKLGASRLATGVSNAKPRMQSFLDQFLPFLANNVSIVKAMPNQTLQQRIDRAVRMMNLNATFKYQ